MAECMNRYNITSVAWELIYRDLENAWGWGFGTNYSTALYIEDRG